MHQRTLALCLTLLLAACGGGTSEAPVAPPGTPPVTPPTTLPQTYVPSGRSTAGDVFVHLFEWRWNDIALECEQFLGPAGYKAVQVSPPSEHALIRTGGAFFPWWQRYQPVSYRLDNSRSGTAAEFRSMVSRCRAANVDIYVDAVINHMTAGAGTGSAGSVYSKYSYPDVPWTATDFHSPCGINSYNSASEVQNCELVGLADLATGLGGVRDRIAAYLTALHAIGVAGFRIDAAKHMRAVDLDAIIQRVNAQAISAGRSRPYVFLEVINNPGEAVTAEQYYGVGNASGGAADITDFLYGYRLSDVYYNRNAATLAGFLDRITTGLLPSDKSVVFVDNHDNQRGSNLSYADLPYAQAVALMLAVPQGYPAVMSSFGFDRTSQNGRDAGPPSDAGGVTESVFNGTTSRCTGTVGSPQLRSWICEHRIPLIAQMVAFRKATAGAPMSDCGRGQWALGGEPNRVAICRDGSGFAAFSRTNTDNTVTLQTRLPAGSYCNVGRFVYTAGSGGTPASCSGAPIVVAVDGTASVPLPPFGTVALHVRAR
jgi:alpha-amylase